MEICLSVQTCFNLIKVLQILIGINHKPKLFSHYGIIISVTQQFHVEFNFITFSDTRHIFNNYSHCVKNSNTAFH